MKSSTLQKGQKLLYKAYCTIMEFPTSSIYTSTTLIWKAILCNSFSFGKQGCADVIGVEDEYPPISAPLRDNLALLLDEAPEVRKPHLHSLVDDLSDRHQVLRDSRNV